MAKVFIDDSGSSSTEPLMYVAGWVGQGETWDRFAVDWGQALTAPNPKPIKYFKLNEAHALKGCFEGFSEPEALDKLMALVEVINRHEIYGVVYLVGRPLLRHMIDKHAITRGGRAHQNLEDPFFICLNSLIGYVLGAEYVSNPNDKVDFIFDGKPGGRQSTRAIAMYEVTRDFMHEPHRSVMGTAAAMDDKVAVPLQAADLLAGQVRAAIKLKDDPEPLATMRRHKFIHVSTVSRDMSGNVTNNPTVPCPDASATTKNIDGSAFFVKQHYFDFLQRNDPARDQGGYDFWRTQITQCGFNTGCIDSYRIAVSRAFWDSSNFQSRSDVVASGLVNPSGSTRPYDNRQFIRWCYTLYLNREPDTGGWNFWLNDLNSNEDYNHIIRAFLLSADYRQRFGP